MVPQRYTSISGTCECYLIGEKGVQGHSVNQEQRGGLDLRQSQCVLNLPFLIHNIFIVLRHGGRY